MPWVGERHVQETVLANQEERSHAFRSCPGSASRCSRSGEACRSGVQGPVRDEARRSEGVGVQRAYEHAHFQRGACVRAVLRGSDDSADGVATSAVLVLFLAILVVSVVMIRREFRI